MKWEVSKGQVRR